MKRSTLVALTILIVLILDQWLKIYVKTNISYGDGFDLLGLSWAKIHFVENEGMAYGISFGGATGKLILSLFRIIMVAFLLYIIGGLIKSKESKWLLFSFALIIAGALGNILDSAFYGVFFSESTFHGEPAYFLSDASGKAGFLHGKVVDMLYFPLIDTVLPEWVPFWGGERFEFFRPVFNLADTAISCGVISIILFHRKFFKASPKKEEKEEGMSDTIPTSENLDKE